METRGVFAPETPAAVEQHYESVGPAAQTVTREVARAMDFDREEYRERVDAEVVETARDALFASLLVVHVGSRAEFEDFRADHPDLEVIERGNPEVERVAWHAAAAADTLAAVTFQDEPDAAVAALRRQVHGGVYRDLLPESGDSGGDDGADASDRADANADAGAASEADDAAGGPDAERE
jgi:hypothetical protein